MKQEKVRFYFAVRLSRNKPSETGKRWKKPKNKDAGKQNWISLMWPAWQTT